MKRILPIACCAALACGLANAAIPFEPYVGVGGGSASVKSQDSSVNLDINRRAGSWKVFGGVHLISFLGVEASYVDLGSFKDHVSGTNVSTNAKVYNLFAVGSFPIFGIAKVYGKAGYTRWDTSFDLGNFGRAKDSGGDLTWGGGVQVNIGPRFAVRGEYERFNASPKVLGAEPDTRLDLVSVGGVFRF